MTKNVTQDIRAMEMRKQGEHPPGQSEFATAEFNSQELQALTRDGILFGPGSGNNFLDLIKGNMLFRPTQNIKVQTREGLAYLPKGSAAFVMETGNDVAFYNFHDSLRTGPMRI